MLKLILLAASMLQSPAPFRELKVGDVIELTSIEAPVYASPQSVTPAPAPVVVAPVPAPVVYGDPYGFGGWLNAHRARHGLRPLAHSGAASGLAAANAAHGHGHHVGGYGRGQCSGWGPLGQVEVMWMASPAHYRILMDPGATAYGIAGNGHAWTVNID